MSSMTLNEYQDKAMRTAKDHGSFERNLEYAALAIVGEAGEVSEVIKKAMFHGKPLDRDHLIKELGDVAWGLAFAAHTLGVTLEEVALVNVVKLKERYPAGFSTDASNNRKPGDV
jgi:NTP pyrophosphatase (non-canonical NTP hydrolase)